MVKVTLHENLVPSSHLFVKGNPHGDLINNVLLARKLIRAAAFIFQLKKDSAVYSGYINEYPKGEFVLRLCQKGIPVRSLVLGTLGYGGELVAEVEDLSLATGFDVFGPLALHSKARLVVCV